MLNESGGECPYDSSHIICLKGLPAHLIKCRQNHKGHKKVACKYDKTHLVPRPELPHHLSICPGRYLLDRELQLNAAAGAEGILYGNVNGPEIVTNYLDGDEDWDAEPSYPAPVALFNRKESDYEEDHESYRYNNQDNANYRNQLINVPSEEKKCRKAPIHASKAAEISQKSASSAQQNAGNQVYLLSVSQSLNAGWGRGRGNSQTQDHHNKVGHSIPNSSVCYGATFTCSNIGACASQKVGVVRPLTQSSAHPHESSVHSGGIRILQPSRVAVERYSSDHKQPLSHSSEDQLEAPPSIGSHDLSHMEQDLDRAYEPAGRYSSGASSSEDRFSDTAFNSQAHMNFLRTNDGTGSNDRQSQTKAPKLPRGRGIFP